MRRFVIVVDMQRDFVAADGALAVNGAETIVGPMQLWLAGLTSADTCAVLFTADTHIPEIYRASSEAEQFPPHCQKGTPGWAVVVDPTAIDPSIPVYRLEKGVFDMWAEPGLVLERLGTEERIEREAFFDSLRNAGIDEVTVVGVAADFCVRWAVEGLIGRGFRVLIPSALTRGITRQIDEVAGDEWSRSAVRIEDLA